jgi:hypothetical protein
MARVRRGAVRKEREKLADEYITRGYRVTDDAEGTTRLKERDWGDPEAHLLLVVLTGWWSFGLLNAIYAGYRYVTAEEVVLTTADEARVEPELERERTRSSETSTGSTAGYAVLQMVSLLVSGLVLGTILAVHTGIAGVGTLPWVLVALAAAVLLRYAALYHQFGTPRYRTSAVALATVIACGTGANALWRLASAASGEDLLAAIGGGSLRLWPEVQLPEWWFAAFLGTAAVLAVVGTVTTWDRSPYPKPSELRESPISPVYYGGICTLFGLWSILFAGISLQRVVVFAPIFEELAKFGVALLVGSVLFGRSFPARIGVALVVGSSFGVVEHVTTYPAETDALYLFRTLFHAMATVLSVAVYSRFESLGDRSLLWIAPGYSMLIHFFYNTFAVLSTVIGVAVFGTASTTPVLVYGAAALLLTSGLFVLVTVSDRGLVTAYEPLEHLLSHAT